VVIIDDVVYFVHQVRSQVRVWYVWEVKKLTPDTDVVTEIKQRRVNLGMTQKQAAERAGTDPINWSKFESGRATHITLPRLMMMAKGVGWVLALVPDDEPPR
jgi:DNA-binding XRE family transcriptional regulator